jgi:hAT family C-terminal dimerisation region
MVSDNLLLRFAANGRSGGQHSCMPVMLGIALHPAVKNVIVSKDTKIPGGSLFTAQQKADTIAHLRKLMARVSLPSPPAAEAGQTQPVAGAAAASAAAHDEWQYTMPGLTGGASAPAHSFRDEVSAWADAPPLSMSAAKFWALELASETSRYPLLRIVARAVYGAPLTTAGDERNFSHVMKLLAKDRKGAMKPGTFEDLMLLRLNHHLWSSNRDLMTNPDFKKYWE